MYHTISQYQLVDVRKESGVNAARSAVAEHGCNINNVAHVFGTLLKKPTELMNQM